MPYYWSKFEEFKVVLNKGGFVSAHWDGTAATEERLKRFDKSDH
jgi:prolyl-tRNA synthetase